MRQQQFQSGVPHAPLHHTHPMHTHHAHHALHLLCSRIIPTPTAGTLSSTSPHQFIAHKLITGHKHHSYYPTPPANPFHDSEHRLPHSQHHYHHRHSPPLRSYNPKSLSHVTLQQLPAQSFEHSYSIQTANTFASRIRFFPSFVPTCTDWPLSFTIQTTNL